MNKNPFYVYILKDPRMNPAKPFYVGKGTGSRSGDHEKDPNESQKTKVIKEIKQQGLDVITSIVADDLTENQALKIEAELISAFGIISRGGLLTNKVQPSLSDKSKKIAINIPDGCYEKAQMGLNLLKASILEFAKANNSGVTNADVAKYLGLQSEYGGGSKDYLSYSILGLLLKEKVLVRRDKKHIKT